MEPVFGGKFPVAAVTNKGKQVVSDDSSAAVILVALVAVVTVTPAIWVSNAVPLTVIASASNVPSTSTSPVISASPATLKSVPLSNWRVVLFHLPVIVWDPALIWANSRIPSSELSDASEILPVIFA